MHIRLSRQLVKTFVFWLFLILASWALVEYAGR
jgi:hypothetical protein